MKTLQEVMGFEFYSASAVGWGQRAEGRRK